MEDRNCPKCGGDMDEGYLSEALFYFSKSQTGMLRKSVSANSARACVRCGYVEFYIQDVDKLEEMINK